ELSRLPSVIAQPCHGPLPHARVRTRETQPFRRVRPARQQRDHGEAMFLREIADHGYVVGQGMKRRQLHAAGTERRQMPHAPVQVGKLWNRIVEEIAELHSRLQQVRSVCKIRPRTRPCKGRPYPGRRGAVKSGDVTLGMTDMQIKWTDTDPESG